MSIRRIALRVQSSNVSAAELMDLVEDRAPDSFRDRGTPVSSRSPSGPVREVSTLIFRSVVPTAGPIGRCVEDFVPVLDQLRLATERGYEMTVDLILMVESNPLGFYFEFSPSELRTLSEYACGLTFDVYAHSQAE